jgi:predicted AlkP superfamily phosphohydrolase/phosphomutase
VIVVSDHGAKKMDGGICINEFFIKQGWLKLKEYPSEPTKLRTSMIDWDHTRVWGEGGYYARVFFNIEGREPNGQIPAAEVESFRAEVKASLEALGDENGRDIGTRVYLPGEVYRETQGTPPDLIVYLGNLDWRSAGTVGGGEIHIFENDTGPDDANHAQEGVFIWSGRNKAPSGPTDKISIYDIAPSILDHFAIDVPETMIGKVI